MNRYYINLFRFFFASLDLLTLNLVHFALIFFMQRFPNMSNQAYLLFFMINNMAWLFCAYLSGMYIIDKNMNFMKFAYRTACTFLIFIFLVGVFIYFNDFNYSWLFVISSFGGFGAILLLSRFLFIYGSGYVDYKERSNRKIVVLGYNELSKKLVYDFTVNKQRISMEGYFDDIQNIQELSLFPILGRLEDCISYAIENQVNEIYSTISPEKNAYIYELARIAENHLIRFKFIPDFQMFVNRNIYIDFVDDIPVLSLRSEPLEEFDGRVKKRFFDIVFSSLVIILLLSWLIPILSLVIWISSRGPVFFIQLRSGKNNRSFHCIKFRTLHLNDSADAIQVTRNDARMTRVGRFLRKTNLDELPQFFNVLLADMSVVGPRPHMLQHTLDYSRIYNEYMVRHFVKPGVTGWAQVNGFRGEIKKEEQLRKRIEHDIWYMENWSLLLDIRIIFMTLYLSLKGDKNAF